MWANFTKVYILGTALKVRKRTKISSSLVYVLLQKSVMHVQTFIGVPKQWNVGHVGVPRQPCGNWTLLLCKTFYCPYKLAQMLATWVNKLYCFLTLSRPSPSSLLKLPNVCVGGYPYANETNENQPYALIHVYRSQVISQSVCIEIPWPFDVIDFATLPAHRFLAGKSFMLRCHVTLK